MLVNNAEQVEAERLHSMMAEICLAHGGDTDHARVHFGDVDGELAFQMEAQMIDSPRMLLLTGVLRPSNEAPSF